MIFEHNNYLDYIESYIKKLPYRGRGFRASMAAHLNCKTSFISQVMNGSHNLSVEQAFLLNSLFKHSENEGAYFLNLVQWARAGNKGLKDYYKKEAEKIRNEALRLKNKFDANTVKTQADEFKYFSSADFSYVHILTTIPEFQTKEALLNKLKMNPNYLDKILDYLMSLGYVVYKKGRYLPGPAILHLPDDSAIIATHHSNWRIQAIKSCQSPEASDFHYSSVISIAEKDFFTIKAMMIKHLEEYRSIINPSVSEKPYSLCFDFYELK